MAVRRRIDLKKTLFLLPSFITLLSVFCGFDAIRICSVAKNDDDFHRASLLLIYALLFDVLDGRVARLTKTQSAFGLQIDSLADIVSFGVAPGLLLYTWSLAQIETFGFLGCFLFVAAGTVRLARFNVLAAGESGRPTKPGKYIVGLPIPGAAGILVSLVVANHAAGGDLRGPTYAWPLLVLTCFLAFCMISTIRFRSFKDVQLNPQTVGLVLFGVGSSALISLKTKPAFVLVWLLGFYVVIGLTESFFGLSKTLATRRHREGPTLPSR